MYSVEHAKCRTSFNTSRLHQLTSGYFYNRYDQSTIRISSKTLKFASQTRESEQGAPFQA